MHPVESSATIKSLSREFRYTQVIVERVQLQTNYHVERSATNKTLCREFSDKQINLQRDQLQTNQPVEIYLIKNSQAVKKVQPPKRP